jgi:hypothetical protein
VPVLRLVPKGCVDAIFGEVIQDDCPHFASLSNLVPAPDTPTQWVPRPGFTRYAGSGVNGYWSCYCIVNSVVYGMINDWYNGSGNDYPVAYNLLSQTFVTVSGYNNSNTPTSPGAGAWVAPHAENIGAKVIITHSGYNGSGNGFFGVIDISNPAAPSYTSGNTSTNALASPPVWVSEFNSRAYYFVTPGSSTPPAVYISDNFANGGPTSRGAAVAGAILTFGNNVPVLGAAKQTVNTTVGGALSALFVFQDAAQGNANIYQITGDPGTSDWALNPLNAGTSATGANTIVSTPKGIMFMAPDGVRMVSQQATVSDPIGFGGTGITVPFISCTAPSRAAAACNGTTYRICTQNGSVSGAPNQEWCYDLTRNIWYGPHTPGFGLIAPFGQSFVTADLPNGILGLGSTTLIPNGSSVYTDFSLAYTCSYISTLIPDRREITMLSSVKAVMYIGYGAGTTTFFFTFEDINENTLGANSLQVSGGAPPSWGSFTWGSGAPLSISSAISPLEIPLAAPVVFDRMSFEATFTAALGIRLGITHIEYQPTMYTVRNP